MEVFAVFRRLVLLMTMALAASALAVTPAFAGEDPPTVPVPVPLPTPLPVPTPSDHSGSANLHFHGCIGTKRMRASVAGDDIDSVAFYINGKKVQTVSSDDDSGDFSFSMSCSRLHFGSNRGKAAVRFESGTSTSRKWLHFQVVRSGLTRRALFTG